MIFASQKGKYSNGNTWYFACPGKHSENLGNSKHDLDKFEEKNVFDKDEYRNSVSYLYNSLKNWQKASEDTATLPDLDS